MKKLTILLCAALAAMTVLSCNKGPKEEAAISPDNQLSKLSSTAVSLLKEADPNYWGPFVKRAQGLFGELSAAAPGNVGFDSFKGAIEEGGEAEEYSLEEDVYNWIHALVESDHYSLYLTSIRLSMFTGDITLKEVDDEGYKYNEFVYTRSANPLNLVHVYDGKTYKFQFEARDADNNIVGIRQNIDKEEEHRTELYFPTKVAVHVTENGASFMDLSIEPRLSDLNWDEFLNYSDEIHANATLTIPGYTLSAQNAVLTLHGISGKLELFHGNTSLIALDGEVEIDALDIPTGVGIFSNGGEDVNMYSLILNTALYCANRAEGIMKLMGGQVVLNGEVYPHNLLLAMRQPIGSDEDWDQDDLRDVSSALQALVNVKVSYDNGSRVQSVLVLNPAKENESDEHYSFIWGLRFPDQSFKDFEDLAQSEAFDVVIGQLAIFIQHGNAIFNNPEGGE